MVVWAGLSYSQSIGYSYMTISKRLKITTLEVKGQGCGIIMGVTRLLLLVPFMYVLKSVKDPNILGGNVLYLFGWTNPHGPNKLVRACCGQNVMILSRQALGNFTMHPFFRGGE